MRIQRAMIQFVMAVVALAGPFASIGLFGSIVHADASKFEVRADVDRPAIEPSQTVNFSVRVESGEEVDIQPPKLPPLSDFAVVSEWVSTEKRASLVRKPNGQPEFKTVIAKVFNWQLSPKRLGALTIFPVEVVVEGTSTRTKALTVRVASGASGGSAHGNAGRGRAQPPPGFDNDDDALPPGLDQEDEDLFSQLLRRGMRQVPQQGGSRSLPTNPNEAFFIQVETDKTEAYVGEQITVSFYLYTTGIIRDLDTLKYPSLKGFWKEDIEIATHLNFQSEVIDGVPYKKALLASFALFPIKEGVSTVDSYQAKCTVISGNDPFGALGMGRSFTFTKSSAPVKIKVKPLPTEGRPADFSGAVGDFQVTARIENNNIVANQPFPLKIRFEGRGNAKLIDIPPFQPPEGMELYETQNDSKFFGWGTSFKEFTLLLIPRREGEFTIPAISGSMFDPTTKKYITRSTEALRIKVGAGAKGTGASESFTGNGGSGAGTAKKTATGPVEPRLAESFRPASSWSLAQAVGGAAGLYAIVFALLMGVAARELGWGRGKPRLGRMVKNRLRDLEPVAKRSDVRKVGVGGVNLLAFALGEIVGDRVSEREVLKLLSATPPTIQKECGPAIRDLLQKFELLAFAPDASVEEWKNPEKLRDLITQASKALDRVVALSGSAEQSV